MNSAAIVQNLGGLVINAGVRDSEILEMQNFPIFARTISYRGTEKYPGGEINGELYFAGTKVTQGDYIVADRDGVVVVPRERAEEFIELAVAREEKEQGVIEKILQGQSTIDIYGF